MTIKGRRPAKTAVPAPPVAPPVVPAYTQYPPPWAYPQYVLPVQAQPVQERPDPPRFERESQPPPPSSPIREHRDITTGSTNIITQFGKWIIKTTGIDTRYKIIVITIGIIQIEKFELEQLKDSLIIKLLY